MTPGRLSEILSAYGADPARWPEAERAAAQSLLAQSPPLQALAREEAALDALLASPAPTAAEAPVDAILARAGRAKQPAKPRLPRWWLAAGLTAAAASLAAALLVRPVQAPVQQLAAPEDTAALEMVFSDVSNEEWL